MLGKVLVFGSAGMVGSATVRKLRHYASGLLALTRDTCDLSDEYQVRKVLQDFKPDWIVLAAAKVGGIVANRDQPQQFLSENLRIQLNVIDEAHRQDVNQLIFLGSSCIYPKICEQPIKESSLLSGYLEPTNEAYAIAKIAGIKLCEAYRRQHGRDYRSVMPTNLYGPGDNYDPVASHVIPGLIRRFHQGKIDKVGAVKVWGTGNAKRDFLMVDDLASAIKTVMDVPSNIFWGDLSQTDSWVNVGSGVEVSIAELAYAVGDIVGYKGSINFDETYPDGTPRKLLDISKIQGWGWRPTTQLSDGLQIAYHEFLRQQEHTHH